MSSPEPTPSAVAVLARTLWFPAFFVLGFMIFYMLPFHAASPHDMPFAVVGDQAATSLGAAFDHGSPGAFDVTAASSVDDARAAVESQDAVAAYDPGSGALYLAGAEGQQVSQVAQHAFGPVAAQSGHPLRVVDIAPTASGDVLGNSLFYIVMAWNICGYIAVMMLMQAVELSRRAKLLTLVGFGAAATVVAWLFGLSVSAIGTDPAVLLVGFVLTQAVAWTTFGLAPIVKRALPGVAMGLFVLLSIPSSGGAIATSMVPGFFQVLHVVMPLGNAIDAARSVLYLGGAGWVRPMVVLLAWVLVGVGLVVWSGRRASAAPDAHAGETQADEEPAPARPGRLVGGRVLTDGGAPVPRSFVTVTDVAGRQVGRAEVDGAGGYSLDVPSATLTVVVHAPGFRPVIERLDAGEDVTRRDYRLDAAVAPVGPVAESGAYAAAAATAT